ncbi:MAG TPA: hypothetical protein VJV79_06915 [Polyangiaceae bacterium]|nr:hypothetical protein [Polyangiaceae bacterium]
MTRRFDLFGWLLSLNRKGVKQMAFFCFLLGPLFIGHFIYRMTQIPWELTRDSPVAIAISSGCDPRGGVYAIVVRDTVYRCGGADTKCGHDNDAPVAYVLDRPRRCRLLRNVGRPSLYELDELLIGLITVSFGAAVVCWDAAWIERLSTPDGRPPPSLAYVIWRAVFWSSLLAFFAIGLWLYSRYGAVF